MNEREIFIHAPEEASPEELAAYLDEACGGDAAMRRRVEQMFAAAPQLGGFMSDPEARWSSILDEGNLNELAEAERPGTVIGNYRLVEEIGRGGFGVVYRAEQQQPIRREVALKILKAGMDTRQVIRRFEAERQALAMMDHPHIAKVLDAGSTDSGRPFFVMELVHGCPITKFCDDRRLDTTGRLELFIDVCHAVQHAHQKGIIHRDLKPSNVMVSDGDDRPTVKVIDFGVAKATQVELGEQTVYTRVGQFIGTPAYMSPEQAGTGGGDIDTRSDIYALGVLLYELLTGTTPFDTKQLAGLGEDELRRMIRETEPPRPSTRVRSSLQPDVKCSDRNGHADPGALQGDLDWIVLMAIEKDRERRYQTVNGLAMDIRRHLEDEPVTAAAPSAIYRFRKYARRHRKVLIPTAAVALALLVGSLISLWQAADARRARRLAEGSARGSQYRVADQLLAADSQDLGLVQLVQLAREQPDDPVAAQRIVSALSYRDFPELVRPVGSPIRGLRLTRAPKFIQGGRKIVSAVAQKGEVRVWDLTSDDPRQSDLVKDLPGSAEMLDVSKDETRIAVPQPSVGKGGQIVILDLGTGEVIRELSRPGIAWWCRFSPSGGYLMSWGYFGGNKRLWNLEDGTDFPVPTGSGSPVANIESNSAAFSPDEKRIVAVGGGDSIAYIWEVEDLEQGKSVDRALQLPHGGTIWWVEFSPDGKYVVTASGDHTAQVWDAETGERHGAVMQHAGKVSQASFSPDGTIVATTSSDMSARLWDADTGQPLSSPMVHDDFVQWCAFNRTGSRLVTTGGAGRAHVWDVGTGRQVGGDFRHGEHVVSVAFSPDGERILTTTLGDAAALWKTPASRPGGAILRHLHRHEVLRANGMVNGGGFSKDGGRVITASRHDGVQLWDAETGLPLGRKLIRDDWGFDAWAAMGEDTRYLVATERSGGIRLWKWEANVGDWSTAKVLRDNGDCRYAEFCPDGKRFLTSGSEVVEVWDLEAVMAEIDSDTTIEPVWTSPKAKGSAPSGLTRAYWARFSPDGNRVVGRADENSVQVWDIVERKPGVILRHDGIVESVAFGPDGLRVATGSHDWTAMVWDAATGERLLPSPLRHSGSVNFVQFSPDGTKVLTASSDGTARLWDASTGEPLAAPLHHDGPVSMAIFSPDGTRVATASVDGSARLWDTLTGLPVSEIFRHESWVRFVAFSPGGDRLLTSGNDGTARIWEVPTVKLPVPTWFLDWAEAVVGSHMENDVATPMDWNRRQEIVVAVKERSGSGFYDQITAWFCGDPTSRAITPFSDITLPEYIASELEAGTAESLEEAARVAPDNVDALYHLANKLWNDHSGMDPGARRRAAYYARQALSRMEAATAIPEAELSQAGKRQQRGQLRRKADLLEWTGRGEDAALLRAKVTSIPPRNPPLDHRMIDLTAHYNDSLFGAVEPDRNSAPFWMERLAELFDPGDGPDFDIRAKIQLNGGRYGSEQGNNAGKDFSEISKSECPMKVEGIAVGQSAAKIHFLLGCSWGREALGVEVAHFTLRYEDGSRSDPIPVTYGKDVVDLWVHSRPKEEVGGVENIAWEHPFRTWDGGEGRLALTRKTWENKEYPGKVISHIDFESAGRQAAPFLVAITVE